MKWLHSSTDSPREIAERFARTAFDPPRELAGPLYLESDRPERYRGLFRLKGSRQVYELDGIPPGQWTVTSKAPPM